MTSTEIIKYLNINSAIPDKTAISEFERLLDQYPFASFMHMIYAKTQKSLEKEISDKYLRKAALYCSNRKKLFNYLNDIKTENVVQQHVPVYRLEHNESDTEINSGLEDDPVSRFIHGSMVFKLTGCSQEDEDDVSQEPEIISEAMAELYLRKYRTDKAIATFEKLSLKYPEKSAYFAARIEKIRKEHLNKN